MRIAVLALVFGVPVVTITTLGCSGGKRPASAAPSPTMSASPVATSEPSASPSASPSESPTASTSPAPSNPPEASVTPEPSATPVASASPTPSPSAAPGGCELEHETLVDGKTKATLSKGGSVEATAFITNRTAADMKLVVRDSCPQAQASFKGFGKVSIYDGSCMMGICATTGDDKTITVAAGARVQVSIVELRTKMRCGDTVVRPGTYTLDFDLAVKGSDPRRCHTTAKVTVK